MKYLNVGCGYPRIEGDEWVNLDNLLSQLTDGTPEKENLLAEKNYIEHDLLSGPIPFEGDTFDGCILLHVLEHFDCQQAVSILVECKRVLKQGGALLASVPDASYFRKVYPNDRVQNWPELFDVTDPNNPIPSFFRAALFFEQHRVLMTEDALWCYFTMAGLTIAPSAPDEMMQKLNRRKFSVEMAGVK